MKLSNILFILAMISFTACTTNTADVDNNHSHDSEYGNHRHNGEDTHQHDAVHEQEEFSTAGDSSKIMKENTHHSHGDGSMHSH
jgi:hypothetical protein